MPLSNRGKYGVLPIHDGAWPNLRTFRVFLIEKNTKSALALSKKGVFFQNRSGTDLPGENSLSFRGLVCDMNTHVHECQRSQEEGQITHLSSCDGEAVRRRGPMDTAAGGLSGRTHQRAAGIPAQGVAGL